MYAQIEVFIQSREIDFYKLCDLIWWSLKRQMSLSKKHFDDNVKLAKIIEICFCKKIISANQFYCSCLAIATLLQMHPFTSVFIMCWCWYLSTDSGKNYSRDQENTTIVYSIVLSIFVCCELHFMFDTRNGLCHTRRDTVCYCKHRVNRAAVSLKNGL